ncbi:MAG TPA: chemotaxis protein CheB [Sphingomicrobium sp.]|nr:chemotaxis protein CheB [Sphingomicrobium sp.]
MPDDGDPSLQAKHDAGMSGQAQPAAPIIVGIGASAGGLDAFKTFLAAMPADSGMAFVLVQHLDPDHDSILAHLLSKATAMPVTDATDGAQVEADHVYVIPPNATLTIAEGRLKLDKPAPPRRERRPIDTFLTSLAEDRGEDAISIILSGVGSDGALGLRKIKEHGGLTLAQAEGDHHAKSGMPQSAADTGAVDYVLPIAEMPAKLADYRNHLNTAVDHKDAAGERRDVKDFIEPITERLAADLGHDFSEYKEKTLVRRIQRRMQVLGVDTAAEYVERLGNGRDESGALFRELLIGVTEYFRDPAAWEALQMHLLPKLVADRKATDPIRVWAPGCATGEEVYSLAILLKEVMQRHRVGPPVQIYGTDIDERAVAVARTARYKKPAPGLSTERMERWFSADGEGYCPIKEIREMCVFAVHDLVKDPPFSKLDLLVCRNLLIYMNTDLQDRVMRKFHYALKPGGGLFLGMSESVSRHAELFATVDKKCRLFRRTDAVAANPAAFSAPKAAPRSEAGGGMARSVEDNLGRRGREVMDKHLPAYVVVDRQHEIRHFSGGETGRYLEPTPGEPSFNLFGLVKNALKPAVRAAVSEAFANGRAVVRERVAVTLDGAERRVTIFVEPIADGGECRYCAVAFRETLAAPPAEAEAEAAFRDEMRALHTQLEEAQREAETTREDARSAREEYQSVNEELQSSNEELETAKEEMQSVNEELQTVNTELGNSNEQLTRLNSDLQNLLDSTRIATLFLDADLRIRNFTPGMTELFRLRDGDRGRPITDIVSRLDHAGLKHDIDKSLRDLAVVEQEIASGDANYIMRIRPYRTVDNVIDGVVITFMDISERKRHEVERARLAAIVDSTHDAIIGHTLDGTVTNWNAAAERLFGNTAEEAIGQPVAALVAKGRAEEMRALLDSVRRGEAVEQIDIVHTRGSGEDTHITLSVSPITDREGEVIGAATLAHDITERHEAATHRELLMHELSHRVKNVLATVQAIALQTLPSSPSLAPFRKVFVERLQALAATHALLLDGDWTGVSLRDVAKAELAPYQSNGEESPRWTLKGRDVALDPKTALSLGLALHELATNAVKYGALSVPAGHIELSWRLKRSERKLSLTWVERDGPPVEPPQRRGFGSRLIEEGLEYELDADVKLDYKPEGLRCDVDVVLDPQAPHAAAKEDKQ